MSAKTKKEAAGEELSMEDLAGVAGGLAISGVAGLPAGATLNVPDTLLNTSAIDAIKKGAGTLGRGARRRIRHGKGAVVPTATTATSGAAVLSAGALKITTTLPGASTARVPGTAPSLSSLLKK